MRPHLLNPLHLKNRIFLCVYIFRSLPTGYIEKVEGKNKKKVWYCVNNLIQQKFLKKKIGIHGFSFLQLTYKGYCYVKGTLLREDIYTHRRDRSSRVSINEHGFMNFVYIWDFISQYPELLQQGIMIYEDSSRHYCKITFTSGGSTISIAPDVLLLIPEPNGIHKQAIFVENDTGVESHKTLAQKIVMYSLLAKDGFFQNGISKATLYFIFHTEKRAKNLMENTGIASHINEFTSTSIGRDVNIFTLLHAFSDTNMRVLYSAFTAPYIFHPYDFKKHMVSAHPSWKYLQ